MPRALSPVSALPVTAAQHHVAASHRRAGATSCLHPACRPRRTYAAKQPKRDDEYHNEDVKEARQSFEEAAKYAPNDPWIYVHWGDAARTLDKKEETVEAWSTALSLSASAAHC